MKKKNPNSNDLPNRNKDHERTEENSDNNLMMKTYPSNKFFSWKNFYFLEYF